MATLDTSRSATHVVERAVLGINSVDTSNTQKPIKGIYCGSFVFDAASATTGVTVTADVAAVGVAVGDIVLVQPPTAWNSGLVCTTVVTAADKFALRVSNVTAGTLDAASGTFTYLLIDLT